MDHLAGHVGQAISPALEAVHEALVVDAQEVAWVTAFLASPKAECITGEAISVSGGSPGAVFQ